MIPVGTRVRVACRPPHPDYAGVIDKVFDHIPWGLEYGVMFDREVPGVGWWAAISAGVVFPEEVAEEDAAHDQD
jgi:hypothetical protein